MTDFLARESELLGEDFGTPTGGTFATADGGDIDFDAAASQFPDISLDGSGDFPTLSSAPPAVSAPTKSSGGFSFDGFDDSPLPKERIPTEVKVTGDDEISKFESEFPDIEVPEVRTATWTCTMLMNELSLILFGESLQPTPQPQIFGATPTFAPRPQQSAFSSTPILTHTIEEDEPDAIKCAFPISH